MQVTAVGAAIFLVVGILLIGLPVKSVEGVAPPTYAPIAPSAEALRDNANLPLDGPFQIQFTKPMNEASVEAALSMSPEVATRYRWDATDQTLSILPQGYWQPNTTYAVSVSAQATDQEGLGLETPIASSFVSGENTAGQITAETTIDGLTSPGTTFQLTFTRPVKLATVLLRWTISPTVDVSIVGDDPTDLASTTFTMTPKAQLDSASDFVVAFADGGTDSAGAPIQPVQSLSITTMTAPNVVRFRPQDGSITYDTHQPVSVRFTVPMDTKATAAAFSVTANGKAVAGSTYWAEDNTVLVLTPRYAFAVGATVVARVSTAARSAGGLHIPKTVTGTFTVKKPTSSGISYGVKTLSNSPWYGSEVYYFNLMNCTRTGKWVTSSGACSTQTRHTMPAQPALRLSATISNKVSRPYAKYMADRRLLDHYLIHDPHWRLCHWAGLCGNAWGENIASPSTYGKAGMIAVEIFYQNESWCRCEHYYNIMAPFLHQAGVGVWVSKSVRVSIDFYG
jgi:uncharacterized protein YkwD